MSRTRCMKNAALVGHWNSGHSRFSSKFKSPFHGFYVWNHIVPCVLSADMWRLSLCFPLLSPRSYKTVWCCFQYGRPSPPEHKDNIKRIRYFINPNQPESWNRNCVALPEPPPPWQGTGTCRAGLWCSSPVSGSHHAATRSHSRPAL